MITLSDKLSQMASSMDKTRIIGRVTDLNTIAISINIAATESAAVTAKSRSVVSISPCSIAPSPVM